MAWSRRLVRCVGIMTARLRDISEKLELNIIVAPVLYCGKFRKTISLNFDVCPMYDDDLTLKCCIYFCGLSLYFLSEEKGRRWGKIWRKRIQVLYDEHNQVSDLLMNDVCCYLFWIDRTALIICLWVRCHHDLIHARHKRNLQLLRLNGWVMYATPYKDIV